MAEIFFRRCAFSHGDGVTTPCVGLPPPMGDTPSGRNVSGITAADCSSSGSSDEESDTMTVNEFGFVVRRGPERPPSLRHIVRERRQKKQWTAILANFTSVRRDHPERLQRRVRKGVPAPMRGIVWGLLLDLQTHLRNHPGLFGALVAAPLPDAEVEDQIARDLHRTFPTHSRFRHFRAGGQQALRNVLHAYAAYNPAVGYVQGMAFLVGTFLMHFPEEEAFWAFQQLMEKYGMETLYFTGLPGLQEKFYQLNGLLKHHLPALHAHFQRQGLDPALYAPQWFLTLFIYAFPPPFVMRIWDVFLEEGWKVVFRVPLALLRWKQQELLKLDLASLLPAIKGLANDVPVRKLMKKVFAFGFSHQELDALGAAYWAANPEVRAAVERTKRTRDAQRERLPRPS